ncbi:MAG: hypothetical protein KDA84_09660, partial [Planctomycetaceae bacterium]|nr:hypothetical protein [Planctomycetaceae bacterium]
MRTHSNDFSSLAKCWSRVWMVGIIAIVLLPITGCGSPDPEAMKAVETAERILKEFENDQSHVVWDCWTDSQRGDVTQIVHRFAKKTPPQVWNNVVKVVDLWGKVLKEKREFALNCPHLEKGHANLKEHGDELADFFTALVESDAQDLEKLENANVGELFKQLDPHLMRAIPVVLRLTTDETKQKKALESYQDFLAA